MLTNDDFKALTHSQAVEYREADDATKEVLAAKYREEWGQQAPQPQLQFEGTLGDASGTSFFKWIGIVGFAISVLFCATIMNPGPYYQTLDVGRLIIASSIGSFCFILWMVGTIETHLMAINASLQKRG